MFSVDSWLEGFGKHSIWRWIFSAFATVCNPCPALQLLHSRVWTNPYWPFSPVLIKESERCHWTAIQTSNKDTEEGSCPLMGQEFLLERNQNTATREAFFFLMMMIFGADDRLWSREAGLDDQPILIGKLCWYKPVDYLLHVSLFLTLTC